MADLFARVFNSFSDKSYFITSIFIGQYQCKSMHKHGTYTLEIFRKCIIVCKKRCTNPGLTSLISDFANIARKNWIKRFYLLAKIIQLAAWVGATLGVNTPNSLLKTSTSFQEQQIVKFSTIFSNFYVKVKLRNRTDARCFRNLS